MYVHVNIVHVHTKILYSNIIKMVHIPSLFKAYTAQVGRERGGKRKTEKMKRGGEGFGILGRVTK